MHFARWKFRRVQPANPTVLMKKHLRPAIWQDSEITAGFKIPEPSEAIFFWESWWSNCVIPHFTPSLKTINSTSRWMDCLIQRRNVYSCWFVVSSLQLFAIPLVSSLQTLLSRRVREEEVCWERANKWPAVRLPEQASQVVAALFRHKPSCASYVLRRRDEKSFVKRR